MIKKQLRWKLISMKKALRWTPRSSGCAWRRAEEAQQGKQMECMILMLPQVQIGGWMCEARSQEAEGQVKQWLWRRHPPQEAEGQMEQ
jgi:hypothetical protein